MSTRHPTTRRAFLAGGTLAALAGPALAQSRRELFYDEPYGADPYDLRRNWPARRRNLVGDQDIFYDTRPVRPRNWDPDLDADPYGADPYGARRRAAPRSYEPPSTAIESAGSDGVFDPRRIYASVPGEPFPVAAFNVKQVRPEFLRREVAYSGPEPAGAIVVDPRARHLFYVLGAGRAVRYGVGVGRQGFAWSGTATVNSKQAWPDWYPPKEMIERDPHLARSLSELQSGIGMPGGPHNPLGARALYLWQGNKDTLYRIHGTTEPWTIGTRASSGCIRMINQDAIDLYARVSVGTAVRVLG